MSVAAIAAILFFGGCVPGRTVPRPPDGYFVARLGTDTLSVEEFTRTPTGIHGRAITRSPRTRVVEFDYRLNPDGSIARAEFTGRSPDSTRAIVAHTAYTFANDSAYIESGLAPDVRVQRIRARPVELAWSQLFPFSMFEVLAPRAPATVGDSVVLSVYFPPLLGGVKPLVLKRVAPDTVTIWSVHMGTLRMHVDPRGHVQYVNGLASSINDIVTRERRVRFDSLARAFALRDVTGALGGLSPRDTVRAVVHGARLMVDYSRPSKRGREIFGAGAGAIVPWARVWRTGANLATHFTTERDVVIGGLTVPAGTYTLWTLPNPEGWQLIVNKQTGQWGTVYDRARDLGRVPMQVRRLDRSVERMTIRIEPRAVGGVLAVAWDTYEATVPFSGR